MFWHLLGIFSEYVYTDIFSGISSEISCAYPVDNVVSQNLCSLARIKYVFWEIRVMLGHAKNRSTLIAVKLH